MIDKPRILIVEDDRATCRSMARTFEKKEYEAETARTGREAIEKARHRFFNLSLLDVRLPDMEGVDLIGPLKELHPDMVVILATDHASLETAVRALGEGAAAYITKPMNLDEVVATVEEALERQRLILENRRLYEAVQQELAERKRAEAQILQLDRELTSLNEVIQAIISTLDLQETLTLIMEHAARLLGAAAGSVILHDEAKGDLWFAAASGEGADFVQGKRLAMGQGIAGWVTQHEEPVLVPDVSQDTRWFGELDKESGTTTRSILCVPLQTKGQTIGVIEVINKEHGDFDEEDLRLLTSLAAPAATAIENARLFAHAQREITERKRAERLLRALNAAAITMERALTPEEMFAAVAQELKKLGFLCVVFLVDESQSRLFPVHLTYEARVVQATEKLVGCKAEDFSVPIEAVEVFKEVVREKKAAFSAEAEALVWQALPEPAKKLAGQVVRTLKVPKSINAPLVVKDQVIGVFAVQSDDLTEDDVPAVTAFAHQVAAAWRKARLMQELEESLTELRQTQSQLVQAQKMEAIGRLAGGMAHDFNNMLTTIMLYTQMVLRKPHMPPDLEPALETVLDESRRAADLVQKMLDFSRRSMMDTRHVDLKSFVEEAGDILRHTLPETIRIVLEMGADEYVVKADPTQIQQVIMNLAVNAQDVMPEEGVLRIALSSVEVKPNEEPLVAGMPAGKWVCLAVSDTGTGITDEAMAHLFEPFFTTKPVGKGTGLGLAQVYGIVKQHEGYIGVETGLGQGTTFRVYFPAHEVERVREAEGVQPDTPGGKGETILLVEDSEKVRKVGQDILESLGYRVLVAVNGREALETYLSTDRVDLVITDMVMPEIGGRELVQKLKKANPRLKALAMTGYTLAEDPQELRKAGIMEVIQKPFEMSTLGEVVRRALDARGA